MKNILLTICITSFCFSNPKKPYKMTVYFANYAHSRGIATDRANFWQDRKYFDTIEIASENLIQYAGLKLNGLKRCSAPIEFDHRVAFIYKNGTERADTFYTDRWFQIWNKNDITYIDTGAYFKTAFGSFLISNLPYKE